MDFTVELMPSGQVDSTHSRPSLASSATSEKPRPQVDTSSTLENLIMSYALWSGPAIPTLAVSGDAISILLNPFSPSAVIPQLLQTLDSLNSRPVDLHVRRAACESRYHFWAPKASQCP